MVVVFVMVGFGLVLGEGAIAPDIFLWSDRYLWGRMPEISYIVYWVGERSFWRKKAIALFFIQFQSAVFPG